MDLPGRAWGTGPRNGLQRLPRRQPPGRHSQPTTLSQDPSLSLIIAPTLKSQLLTLAPLTNHDLSLFIDLPLGSCGCDYSCPVERRARKLGRERCGFRRRMLSGPQTWGRSSPVQPPACRCPFPPTWVRRALPLGLFSPPTVKLEWADSGSTVAY